MQLSFRILKINSCSAKQIYYSEQGFPKLGMTIIQETKGGVRGKQATRGF